jgi:hypothetical protein
MADDMRAFGLTWLAFVLAATAAACILTVGYWVSEAMWPTPEDDMPPLMPSCRQWARWGPRGRLGVATGE